MKIKLVCPMLVLENEFSQDIRKNDIKKLKLLVNENNEIINVEVKDTRDIKQILKDEISSIIDSNDFHLEQVYTLGEEKYYFDKTIDIIYLAITNKSNIKNLNNKYKLIDFQIKDFNITYGNEVVKFENVEKIKNNNIEYYHSIKTKDKSFEKRLLEILIAYKQLKNKLDMSDIVFKFMAKTFTLEDVRIVYEMIKEVTIDKSNFRKKIIKYCEEVSIDTTKKGYRPSKTFKFKVLEGDSWL